MRRRLDLAVSLIASPPVLFLDEPTTGLDPRSRNDLWEMLRGLVAEGTTLLLTTQYLEEADQLADNIVVFNNGRIIAQGTPLELKQKAGNASLVVTVSHATDLPTARELIARTGADVHVDVGARQLTAAANGIADATGDYLAYHSIASTESNLYFQFTGQWVDYLSAGKALLDLLQSTGDPRLSEYFDPNADGDFVGADPGDDIGVSPSPLSATRLDASFQQPLATWAENALIVAEAANQAGDDLTARANLDAVRADAGLGPVGGGGGAALLQAIMTEKYIRLFQSPEAWNDYKRTCIPPLVPASGSSFIPGRFVYPLSERNANTSIPDGGPLQNWNDPNVCP